MINYILLTASVENNRHMNVTAKDNSKNSVILIILCRQLQLTDIFIKN
jgi:hypothetical protein